MRVGHGGKGELAVPSNMLVRVFDLPSVPNNVYPASVARFMSTPAPQRPRQPPARSETHPRLVKVGRLPSLDTPEGREKVARLASRPGQNIRLSIGDLADRQNMLYDFRARVSFTKRDLDAIPQPPLETSDTNP